MSQIEMTIATPATPFESTRRFREDGSEFWSARELMGLLGYEKWERFEGALDRAKISAEAQGDSDYWLPGAGKPIHFFEASHVTTSGKGRAQVATDVHLSRFACYLVAMNGDPRKPEIAAAQRYFAIRTRQAEKVEAAAKIEMGTATYHQIFMEGYKQGRSEARAETIETLERVRVFPIKIGRPPRTDAYQPAPTEKVGDDGTFLLPGMVEAVKGSILKFAGEQTTMTAIFEHVRIPRNRANEMGVAYLLKSNGYERFHQMSKGIRTWVYRMAEHA